MSRQLRMFEPGKLYLVTNRTLEGRLFMMPSVRINNIIGSALARAVERFGVRVYGGVFLANHYHLLIQAAPAAIPRFMQQFQSVVARKINRVIGRRGPFWERRYSAESVEDEPAAERLMEYICAHGVKEGLVEQGHQWPGVHMIDALLGDRKLTFEWEDWSERYCRELRGEAVGDGECVSSETLELAKLPWLTHLDDDAYRARMAEIYRSAMRTARAARGGKPVLGRRHVLAQNPRSKPRRVSRCCRPPCHASTPNARRAFRSRYREFYAAYQIASAEFLRGRLGVTFPEYAFRPPAWLIDPSSPLQQAA